MPDKVVLNDNESQEWQSSRLLLFFILKCFAKMRVKELGARKETNRERLKEVSKCMSAAIRVSINLRNFTFPEIGKFREISLQKKGTTCMCIQNRRAF